MEWAFDATDPVVVSDVRRELVDHLVRHAEPGAPRRTVELVFDELVDNVRRHAPGPAWVRVDWTERQPVLHVRDLGRGFSLADVLRAPARGGLRIVSDVAGPLHAHHRGQGTDLSVRLPIDRAQEPVAITLGTAGGLLPDRARVGDDGSVGRDAFLGALVVQLTQAVEQAHGPAAGQSAVTAVGAAIGTRIEQEHRRVRALTDRLPPVQLAELFVSLQAAVGGDFYVISVDDEQIVLGNRCCPFGEAVRKAPSLCRMTAGMFQGIAERNAGPASVHLEQRIAVGDPECRVVVSLHDRTAAASDSPRIPAPRGRRLRAVLAEDAVFMREPLLRVLGEAGIDVVAQCDNPRDVLARVRTYEPDVAIVDFREGQTAEALVVAGDVRREHRSTGVVVLAEEVAVAGARVLLEAADGGIGYLLKDRVTDVDDFVAHVRTVADGGTALDAEVIAEIASLHAVDDPVTSLTPREVDVLRLLAQGLSNDAIAAQLVVTKRAVEKHVGNIFLKLDLQPSSEHERRVVAALAYRHDTGRR